MKRNLGVLLLGICFSVLTICGTLIAQEPVEPAKDSKEAKLSPEAQTLVENSVKLLSKIMEEAIQKATAKAVELIPDAGKKTDEELNKIMDAAVREITLEALKKEKFEEAVIEAVNKCAEEAFQAGLEEAAKEEAPNKKPDSK